MAMVITHSFGFSAGTYLAVVWLEITHESIVRGASGLKWLQDGSLHTRWLQVSNSCLYTNMGKWSRSKSLNYLLDVQA